MLAAGVAAGLVSRREALADDGIQPTDVAQRLIPLLEKAGCRVAHNGALDITLYRDDLSTIGPNAVTRGTEIDFDVTDTWLVLVDDVLYTGRSVRAALDALVDLGRPRAIKLAVVGTGAADKAQVSHMVQALLTIAQPATADVSDALAVALCHGQARRTALRLVAAGVAR